MNKGLQDLNLIFPSIKSFEEFENFKLKEQNIVELAVQEVLRKHELPPATLNKLEGTNIVYDYDNSRIIKIYPPIHKDQYISENLLLKKLEGKLTIKTPVLEFEGEISGWPYIVISKIEGDSLEGLWETLEHSNKVLLMQQLGALIREVHALPIKGLEILDCHWDEFIKQQMSHCVSHHRSRHLPESLLQQIPAFLEGVKKELPKINNPVILTGEYTPMNLIVKKSKGVWHIEGLIDFGDSMLGLAEYDLLGPICFLIQGDKVLLKEFLKSYGIALDKFSSQRLEVLTHKLTALILLHKYSNLNIQIRIPDWKDKVKTLEDLQQLIL